MVENGNSGGATEASSADNLYNYLNYVANRYGVFVTSISAHKFNSQLGARGGVSAITTNRGALAPTRFSVVQTNG
jgi:hypothetical protein